MTSCQQQETIHLVKTVLKFDLEEHFIYKNAVVVIKTCNTALQSNLADIKKYQQRDDSHHLMSSSLWRLPPTTTI